MPTRYENLFRIRDFLDNPEPNNPSFHRLLMQEIAEEMDIVNELNNTSRAWATDTYQLNYFPGQDSYAINVSNFGKPIMVLRQTTNPYIPWLPVPFDDITEMQYGTILQAFYNSYAMPYVLPETIEHISFFRDGVLNAQYKCRIQPAPLQTCVYQITYLPGYIGTDDPLQSAISMPEHAELVRLRAAAALLPYSKWGDDANMNSIKRKELADSFRYQLERKEPLFRTYIRNLTHPRTVTIDDWNYGN